MPATQAWRGSIAKPRQSASSAASGGAGQACCSVLSRARPWAPLSSASSAVPCMAGELENASEIVAAVGGGEEERVLAAGAERSTVSA